MKTTVTQAQHYQPTNWLYRTQTALEIADLLITAGKISKTALAARGAAIGTRKAYHAALDLIHWAEF